MLVAIGIELAAFSLCCLTGFVAGQVTDGTLCGENRCSVGRGTCHMQVAALAGNLLGNGRQLAERHELRDARSGHDCCGISGDANDEIDVLEGEEEECLRLMLDRCGE